LAQNPNVAVHPQDDHVVIIEAAAETLTDPDPLNSGFLRFGLFRAAQR
jgi:hypothetical protein